MKSNVSPMLSGEKRSEWRWAGPGAVLVVLLTLLVYLPAMRGGFLWDDTSLITGNQMIRTPGGLHRFWFTTEAPDYWPVTSTAWWLEWRCWGNQATGYHVVNILLHALNAVLVWVVLRQLKVPGAWLAGLVFAVHPVNVATVAWISEQKNTLSMFFYLVAILLYLRFDEEGRWHWYGLSLAAFLLALLSKTAVVMLPVVLLGCIWWMRGRVRRTDFLRCVPFFALALGLGLVTIWLQLSLASGDHPFRTSDFLSRLAIAGWAPWFYLSKTILPFHLTVIYPKWEIDPSQWISYVPGMIAIGCLTVFWWKRRSWGRPLFFGLGYFVVTLFPVLGIFHQSFHEYSWVADHWQYCAIVGVIALVAAVAEKVYSRMGRQYRGLTVLAGGALLVLLIATTWTRASVYQTDATLWRDNISQNPLAWVAYDNLGLALRQSGRAPEAIEQYEQALRIKPDYADAHNNLGVALVQMRRVPEAIGHYEQALQIKPHYAGTHNNLGVALLVLGRATDAAGHFEQALTIQPDYAEAHYNLGLAQVRQGLLAEAIEHWKQAVRFKGDYPEAYYNLGLASEQTRKDRDAIGYYEQALRVRPGYAEAQNNLAWLLATLTPADGGDPVRAVTLARRTCELTGNQVAMYVDTLAIACAAAGRFNDAVQEARKAIGLAGAAGQQQLAREIETRLELYRNGRAYRPSADGTGSRSP